MIGRPHPLSPAEQRLAHFLSVDSTLAGLFQFNVPVQTHRGERYIVDLCCHLAKLIIEVDGYSTHSSRAIFQSDRKRDFELAIDGYTVVRLTHAEVMSDIAPVMEKIRALLDNKHVY
jgi:very-short-patch-repair endonuclease